jgi:hypothetical protein
MQLAQAPPEEPADAEPFLTEVRYLEKTTLVAMSGDLGSDDITELRRLIIGLVDKERKTVILDMARMRSLHPSGVEVIIEARRYLVARGGDLILRAPVPSYFRVLAGWMREGSFEIADAPPID